MEATTKKITKRAKTSPENGKLGGRPVGSYGTRRLREELFREYVFGLVKENQKPLIKAMLTKAKDGDTQAFNALMDRAVGKPQTLGEEAAGDLDVAKKLKELQDALIPLTNPARGSTAVRDGELQGKREAGDTD